MEKLLAKKDVPYFQDCPYITHKTDHGVKYHPKVGSAFCKKCHHFKGLTETDDKTYVMCMADETRKLE